MNDFLNTYTFDNLQRLIRMDQAGQSGGNAVAEKRIDLEYNAASQFTTLIRYKDLDGGSTNIVADTAWVYDDAGRLVNLAHYHDMTMLAEYDWTYDLGSRVTTLDFDSAEGDNGLSEYGYDNTSQLVSADHDYMSDGSWSFDENGNRTNTGYTTGDKNRLTSDGIWNYGYDDEGNRTCQERISSAQADDKRIEYTWDYRNRLTRIVYKNNQGTITKDIHYVYDVFDRRIEKEIDADGAGGGGSIFVHYIYDGDHIALTFDGNDDLTSRTLHNPQATDMFFAQEDFDTPLENGGSDPAGELLWALLDNLLSNRDLVDNDGNVQNHRAYDPWGNLVTETAAAVDSMFGFTSREIDEESPLQYNRARYFDATTGRWISEDPIGFAARDPNLFRYVVNSAANRTDPSGQQQLSRDDGGYVDQGIDPLPPMLSPPEPRIPPPDGFEDSLRNSITSIGLGLTGLVQVLSGDPRARQTFEDAYELGPLGQTQHDDGIYYYGTRGALTVSVTAISICVIVMSIQARAALAKAADEFGDSFDIEDAGEAHEFWETFDQVWRPVLHNQPPLDGGFGFPPPGIPPLHL